jgi:SAM-dependent methyltransferase
MSEMKRYWDARAAEDAFYFVDNTLAYGEPEVQRFWAGGPELLELILDWLDVRIEPSDEIVEIGCGVGRFTRALASQGAGVRAIDVSERMLALAREHNPDLAGVDWLLGDGTTLAKVDDASADVCFSHVVFQHIPDPEITLGYVREMGRVLRPGGWSAFQISNQPEIHERPPRLRQAKAWLRSVAGRAPRGQAHPAWRGSAVDLDRLAAAAAEGGLRVERVVGERTQFCFVLLRAGSAVSG